MKTILKFVSANLTFIRCLFICAVIILLGIRVVVVHNLSGIPFVLFVLLTVAIVTILLCLTIRQMKEKK